jgi:hypothetical protein
VVEYGQGLHEGPAAPVDEEGVRRKERGKCPSLLPVSRRGDGAALITQSTNSLRRSERDIVVSRHGAAALSRRARRCRCCAMHPSDRRLQRNDRGAATCGHGRCSLSHRRGPAQARVWIVDEVRGSINQKKKKKQSTHGHVMTGMTSLSPP